MAPFDAVITALCDRFRLQLVLEYKVRVPTNPILDLPTELGDLVFDELLKNAVFIINTQASSRPNVVILLDYETSRSFRALACTSRQVHDRLYKQTDFPCRNTVPFVSFPSDLNTVVDQTWKLLSEYHELRVRAGGIGEVGSISGIGEYKQRGTGVFSISLTCS